MRISPDDLLKRVEISSPVTKFPTRLGQSLKVDADLFAPRLGGRTADQHAGSKGRDAIHLLGRGLNERDTLLHDFTQRHIIEVGPQYRSLLFIRQNQLCISLSTFSEADLGVILLFRGWQDAPFV